MCGITVLVSRQSNTVDLRNDLEGSARKIRHRGPDWSGAWCDAKAGVWLAHERLGIVNPETGAQPIESTRGVNAVLVVNGEIYNHAESYALLYDTENDSKQFEQRERGWTDCTSIMELWEHYDGDLERVCNSLNGVYAFAIYDIKRRRLCVARDPLGVCPLYESAFIESTGIFKHAFCSELKGLPRTSHAIRQFPAGTCSEYSLVDGDRHVTRSWTITPRHAPLRYRMLVDATAKHTGLFGGTTTLGDEYMPACDVDDPYGAVRRCLEAAVERRLMCDVPFGVLLSGGLDSSLVASIVARKIRSECDGSLLRWPQLHTFSVGTDANAPDLIKARAVAEEINSIHHEIVFDVRREALPLLRSVIYHLETYDVTTIRSSVPMYLLMRIIKAYGIKMVLSGEGADEALQGYLYWHRAPSVKDAHVEAARKLVKLVHYDVLRVQKIGAAWGVEIRVPFLDHEFVDLVMDHIDPALKMVTNEQPIEKHLLRKAFDIRDDPYLPDEALWRQKEQFSDGVGYEWIDTLRQYADEQVTDDDFARRAELYDYQTPETKEAYLYRSIFEDLFKKQSLSDEYKRTVVHVEPSIACSTATALAWEAEWATRADPSGRSVVEVHGQ